MLLRVFAAVAFVAALTTASRLSGAIFTSLVDGTQVNANIYASKEDVFLNGGPSANGNCGRAGLPAGDYYFMVTDPSGRTLLSTDPITQRKVSVGAAGVFSSAFDHATHAGTCGGITVQLMPYLDTPNNGGEYKVWITPVSKYSPGNENHGFIPSDSKTDNFKVRTSTPPITGCLNLHKIYDANADGIRDENEVVVNGWQFSVQSTVPNSPIAYYTTPVQVFLPLGTYTVCDLRPKDWQSTPWRATTPLCGTVTVSDSECIDVNRLCYCVGLEGPAPLPTPCLVPDEFETLGKRSFVANSKDLYVNS